MTESRGDAVHVTEGTIHAWLDGALPAAEAEALQRHVAGCAACTAAVGEARGLIAASSRIVGALDAVPGGVLPAGSRVAPPTDAAVRPLVPTATHASARPRAWRRWPVQAAAAVALVAVGTWSVVAREQPTASSVALDDRPVRTEESVEAARAPMPAPASAPPAGAGASAGGGGAAPASPRTRPDAPAVTLDAAQRTGARERAPAAVRTETPAADVETSAAASARVPAVVTRPAEAVAFAAGAERLERRRMALAGTDSVAQRPGARAPAAGVETARAPRAARAAPGAVAAAVPVPAPAPAPPPPPAPAAVAADVAGVAVTTVSGRVTTATGEPVPDASVTVPGTLVVTTTDAAGRFSIAAPVGAADSAIVRRVGYRTATVRLQGAAGRTVGVVLEPAEVRLSEVTVTATTTPSVAGCYQAELDAAAPAALRRALGRALAEPLRLTDETAGGAWSWVRAGARSTGGAAVARWRETAQGVTEVQWPTPTGPRLRLRGAAAGLAGEARLPGDGTPAAVVLRRVGCAGA